MCKYAYVIYNTQYVIYYMFIYKIISTDSMRPSLEHTYTQLI